MSQEVMIVSGEADSLNNGKSYLFKAPSDDAGGGISIVGVSIEMVGTASVNLVKAGTAATGGTPVVNGTLASSGSIVSAAGEVNHLTLASSVFVDADETVWLQEANVGTPSVLRVSAAYKMGK